jgi:hypothetical protein
MRIQEHILVRSLNVPAGQIPILQTRLAVFSYPDVRREAPATHLQNIRNLPITAFTQANS